ncbi:hypothetical protein [Calothrix sp. NIES-2098]|uniref:hypothetical protein n=1 Tax=Calothrix sp. NIES-2098 TaxID=1954171 RepID=UPI000B5F4758|nr:hypothetical protein NIES2098_36210 [Calothrix sp. NIES-2098]
MQKQISNFALLLLFNSITVSQLPSPSTAPNLNFPDRADVLDNGCLNRQNGIFWTFIWSQVPNATTYHLYVIEDNAQNPVINQTDIKSTEYIYQSFGSYIIDRNRRGWRWKVRAKVNGQWTNWSEESFFDVEPLNTDCK